MKQHTSGPWFSRIGGATVEVCHEKDGRSLIVARVSSRNSIRETDEEIADGHLIAAAPEMLKALEEIKEIADYIGLPGIYEISMSAIMKARES